MKKQKLEKLLFKSFDAPLSKEEKELLESELKNSPSLKEEQEFLNRLRRGVEQSAVNDFEPFFEERLMGKLNRSLKNERTFDSISIPLFSSFGRIAIAAVIILIILISYNVNNGNNYAINNLLGNSKTNIASVFDPFQNTIGAKK